MDTFTIGLVVIAVLIGGANWWLGQRPRKNGNVKISFIPPAPKLDEANPQTQAIVTKFDAHMSAVNQKMLNIHSRLDALEKAVAHLAGKAESPAIEMDSTSIIPAAPIAVAKTRKGKK